MKEKLKDCHLEDIIRNQSLLAGTGRLSWTESGAMAGGNGKSGREYARRREGWDKWRFGK